MRPAEAGADAGSLRLFYYFNGLNSAVLEDFSGSAKILAASRFAEAFGFRFVPVSMDYRRAAAMARQLCQHIATDAEVAVFCGSSMGGWFARVMQLRVFERLPEVQSATLAWNPAYDLAGHAHLLIGPQQNHVTGERYEWTQKHSAALVRLEQSVRLDDPLPWFVYTDQDDEVIAWDGSRDWHRDMATFVDFPGGCHSFDHYNEALQHFAVNWLGAPARQ